MEKLLDQTTPSRVPNIGPSKPLEFEEVIGPEHLKMISRASGGFRIVEDASLAAKFTQTGVLSTGFTYIFPQGGGEIHYNPLLRTGVPELGIEPWTRADFQGFAFHEAGHHAPEVLDFQRRLISLIGDPDMIPKAYRSSPEAEVRFWRSINRHLNNSVIDIWDEAFMGRRPYGSIERVIRQFQSAKGEMDDYRDLSMPEQLMQIILRSRYLEQQGVENKVSSQVFESFQKLIDLGAVSAIKERRDFENPFATPKERDRSIERKVNAYKELFLSEYIKLMEAELEKRKQERQQQKQQGQQAEQEEQDQPMPGEDEAVPLTDEEEQELVEQILSQLEEAGKEYESQTLSEEEKAELDQRFGQINQSAQAREAGQQVQPEPEEAEAESGLEVIRKLAEEQRRKDEERARRGLAQSMGVKQESIQRWNEIKEAYKQEILSTAAVLAEIFLDDRRKRLEYLRREGEIVPGLESETIVALLSGELDPETKMIEVRNPEFLETELEFIFDTSGSMGGRRISNSVDAAVIVTESFKKVRESLDDESLLLEGEQPFRVGATSFSTIPVRITTLEEPLDDKKETTIIEKASMIGGGTDETSAVKQTYEQLRLGNANIIKIITLFSDGQGNRAGLAPILRQIEADDQVIFLVVAYGSTPEDSKAVAESYLSPLQNREGNIFSILAPDPAQGIPRILEFLKREVDKRRTH